MPKPAPLGRAQRVTAFLERTGWGGAQRRPLAGDASFRRYERLEDEARRAVLMDATPPAEDVRPFAALAHHLRKLGYSAPEVFAEDAEDGLLVIEDFGDQTYTRMLARGADEWTLYAFAVDLLINLHRRPPTEVIPAGLAPYDDTRLLDEALLLTDWYMPAVLGGATGDTARREYADAWLATFPAVHAQPRTLVLRDYHVDNLMGLAGRDGIRACGLLDFQDAVAGPAAYDLVSLLEDARRDVGAELAADMLVRYLGALPALNQTSFKAAYAILGAQRHAKVIGIFTRLDRRDGKSNYLVHIPRVWRLLEEALAHPALAGVAAWLERHVPPEARQTPPAQGGSA
ncbi:MAG: phosphotransferase [Rhodospirillales bacterium]|nr:phosphotransferase [Rhodospirillales bacterium]